MKYSEVKSQLTENENLIAKRTGWQTDKKIDRNSVESISEADRQSDDWIVREKINEGI